MGPLPTPRLRRSPIRHALLLGSGCPVDMGLTDRTEAGGQLRDRDTAPIPTPDGTVRLSLER